MAQNHIWDQFNKIAGPLILFVGTPILGFCGYIAISRDIEKGVLISNKSVIEIVFVVLISAVFGIFVCNRYYGWFDKILKRKKMVTINLIWMLVTLTLVYLTYAHSVDSYKAVGRNNGLIEARWEAIESLKKMKKIDPCSLHEGEGLQSYIDVKSSSLMVIPTSDSSFKFCVYE